MIFSMTGFASLEREIASGILVIELRAVNHRFLELQIRLDDSLRRYEQLARELIAAKLGRGKVECRIILVPRVVITKPVELDVAVLEQLVVMSETVQKSFPQSQSLTVAEILRWPGVLKNDSVLVSDGANADSLQEDVRTNLTEVLQDLYDARAREGAKLKVLILERLAEMEDLVAQVKPLLPLQVKAYQERSTAKLVEVMKTADKERVRQELVLFAQRIDVDEELTRLIAHIEEVRRVLEDNAAAGKRLDFLMQELNREANTLGSKSVSTEVSQVSMNLKVLIEQMREHAQNIE